MYRPSEHGVNLALVLLLHLGLGLIWLGVLAAVIGFFLSETWAIVWTLSAVATWLIDTVQIGALEIQSRPYVEPHRSLVAQVVHRAVRAGVRGAPVPHAHLARPPRGPQGSRRCDASPASPAPAAHRASPSTN